MPAPIRHVKPPTDEVTGMLPSAVQTTFILHWSTVPTGAFRHVQVFNPRRLSDFGVSKFAMLGDCPTTRDVERLVQVCDSKTLSNYEGFPTAGGGVAEGSVNVVNTLGCTAGQCLLSLAV